MSYFIKTPKLITRLVLFLGAFLFAAFLSLPYTLKIYADKAWGVQVSDISLSWGQLDFTDVKDSNFQISKVAIKFGFWDLCRGKIQDVWIEKVQYQAPVASNESAEFPNLINMLDGIPAVISHVEVKDISIQIPSGILAEPLHITGQFEGVIDSQNGHKVSLNTVLQATSKMKGGHVNVLMDGKNSNIDISINEIRLQDIPAAFTVKGKAVQAPGVPLTFTGELTNDNHEIFIQVQGSLENAHGGQLTFKIPGLLLNSEKIPLRVLAMDALNSFTSYSANVKGEGAVTWDSTGIRPTGVINISNGGFVYETINAAGLHCNLILENYWPHLNGTQDIVFGAIQSPVMDLSQVSLKFMFGDHTIKLLNAEGKVWGGSARMSAFTMSPLPADQLVNVTLDKVSLQPLMTHLELEKVKASGLINGRIPIHIFGDSSASIKDGLISSAGSGFISYQWDAALESTDPNLLLAAKALQDFTYNEASLTINKVRYQEPELVLDIRGKNPKLLEGRNFDFKINVTGKILQAIESTIQTFQADIKNLKKTAHE